MFAQPIPQSAARAQRAKALRRLAREANAAHRRQAIEKISVKVFEPEVQEKPAAPKKRRGRPPGSKNKTKAF